MRTHDNERHREWLQAAARSEEGHYAGGISLGGLILLIVVLAILF